MHQTMSHAKTAHEYDLSLSAVGAALEKRGHEVSIVKTLSEAAELVVNTIVPAAGPKSVSFGGSTTVEKADLVAMLKKKTELDVLDTYDRSVGMDVFWERRRQALLVDLFICSANAVSADGKLFLLDNFGNRTAAVQFGPKKVLLLVGKNKITTDSHAAMARVRNVAAPANCRRFDKKTPCIKSGHCMNCNSPERICSVWTIVERSMPKGRIHVVLFDEEVGF